MGDLGLTVVVYCDESFYFAHMMGWQRGLVAPLTKKYWAGRRRRDEPRFEFASDETIDRFWKELDAERFADRFTLSVAPDATGAQLVKSAMRHVDSFRARHPRLGLVGLYHLESGERIDEGHDLGHYAIEDGDHLGLILEYQPRGLYSLIAMPDSRSVFAAIRSADERPPAADEGALRGALLYTDEDPEIATYVRKHFASLSEASGPNLHFYVIEQPEAGWREASRYWKGILSGQFQREWATLGWLRTKPYRPAEAYAVARRLGVHPDQLPCLVLFENPTDDNKIIFPLLDGSAAFFRSLFAELQRLVLPGQSSEISFDGVRRNFDSILQVLREKSEVVERSDRAEYRFEGQTVFINRPAGPVHLSHFQNRSDEGA